SRRARKTFVAGRQADRRCTGPLRRIHQERNRQVGQSRQGFRREADTLTGMSGRLADKVAIVTGAGCVGPGWGNGRAAAVIFAQEGAKVFAVDKTTEPMKEAPDRVPESRAPIKPYLCDVTNNDAV